MLTSRSGARTAQRRVRGELNLPARGWVSLDGCQSGEHILEVSSLFLCLPNCMSVSWSGRVHCGVGGGWRERARVRRSRGSTVPPWPPCASCFHSCTRTPLISQWMSRMTFDCLQSKLTRLTGFFMVTKKISNITTRVKEQHFYYK